MMLQATRRDALLELSEAASPSGLIYEIFIPLLY